MRDRISELNFALWHWRAGKNANLSSRMRTGQWGAREARYRPAPRMT
jgi:hypothetical protein